MWKRFDKDGNNKVDAEEFKQGILSSNVNFTAEEALQLFHEFDKDDNRN